MPLFLCVLIQVKHLMRFNFDTIFVPIAIFIANIAMVDPTCTFRMFTYLCKISVVISYPY